MTAETVRPAGKVKRRRRHKYADIEIDTWRTGCTFSAWRAEQFSTGCSRRCARSTGWPR